VIVLLPIVPAFILFHALPSTAVVSGPLQGLKINLGGAFAAYFALLVLVFWTHNIWGVNESHFEVSARVVDEEGQPIKWPITENVLGLVPEPGDLSLQDDGNFTWRITTRSGRFPKLILNVDKEKYQAITIPLDPKSPLDSTVVPERVFKDDRIVLNKIILHRLPKYVAAQTVVATPLPP